MFVRISCTGHTYECRVACQCIYRHHWRSQEFWLGGAQNESILWR